ncbi:MAG: divalent-cation tolerance protein CutA [Verrucomicrobiae bacterium]|nr:divalent-cation tolerance protein CutA [Verrucomicrobiae bacterium]
MRTGALSLKNYCVVFVTAGSRREARKLAQTLLERRLAACASIVPGVESHYWWQGKVDCSREWLLVMKTRRSRFRALRRVVKQLHSYQVPEIIAVPLAAGEAAYLRWIDASLAGR